MSQKTLPLDEQRYYELLSFLVSGAYLMYQGEQYDELYPSLRLLQGASRLTQSIIDSGGFAGESWPTSLWKSANKASTCSLPTRRPLSSSSSTQPACSPK